MTDRLKHSFLMLAMLVALGGALTGSARALDAGNFPGPGMVVMAAPHPFDGLVKRLKAAIADNKMGLVTQASASAGAAGRGIKIPGNRVVGVYRNDFAVRMLEASVAAGIEAPLRYYVTENADGTGTLSYRRPSAVFKPYKSADLDAMAAELDTIFDKIARQAAAP